MINEDVEMGWFWFCWQRNFGYPPETVAGNCNIGGSPVNEKKRWEFVCAAYHKEPNHTGFLQCSMLDDEAS